MDLSVIIVSFNTQKLLKDCLDSVFIYTKGISFEVWVVDNASRDKSVELVKKLSEKHPNLKLIKNKRNLGFAKANNQALKKAQGEYCLLLNSDTLLENNALKKMASLMGENPKMGVLGPRLLNKDGSLQPSVSPFFTLFNVFLWLFTGDRFLYSSPKKAKMVGFVMGSAFMIRKEVLGKVGFLDENFFMYVEEQEWCYRIKKAGWEVWFTPEAKIYHLVRGSSPEGRQKAIWWIYQGLLYFYQKHFAPGQLIVLKSILKAKAAGAWLVGLMTNNDYLRETYAKAFRLVK